LIFINTINKNELCINYKILIFNNEFKNQKILIFKIYYVILSHTYKHKILLNLIKILKNKKYHIIIIIIIIIIIKEKTNVIWSDVIKCKVVYYNHNKVLIATCISVAYIM